MEELTKLTPIDGWPERKLPQERFDEKIQAAMNQMVAMVANLNQLIPQINTLIGELNSKLNISDLSGSGYTTVTEIEGGG